MDKEAEPVTRWANTTPGRRFLAAGCRPWPVRKHHFPFKRARPDAIRERQKEKPGTIRVVFRIWHRNLGFF